MSGLGAPASNSWVGPQTRLLPHGDDYRTTARGGDAAKPAPRHTASICTAHARVIAAHFAFRLTSCPNGARNASPGQSRRSAPRRRRRPGSSDQPPIHALHGHDKIDRIDCVTVLVVVHFQRTIRISRANPGATPRSRGANEALPQASLCRPFRPGLHARTAISRPFRHGVGARAEGDFLLRVYNHGSLTPIIGTKPTTLTQARTRFA